MAAAVVIGKLAMKTEFLRRGGVIGLALLLVGAGMLPQVVYCMGDNGHRAFEFAAEACCHSHASSGSGEDCASSDNHCSSTCSDLEISSDPMLAKSGSQGLAEDLATTSVVFAVLPLVSSLPGFTLRTDSGTRTRLSFSTTPRERHTTVQLC